MELEWIPIEIGLPDIDRWVIVYNHRLRVVYHTYTNKFKLEINEYNFKVGFKWNITHWMYLPPPPEGFRNPKLNKCNLYQNYDNE